MWFDRGDPEVDPREDWILTHLLNGKWHQEERKRKKGFFSFVGTCFVSWFSRAFG